MLWHRPVEQPPVGLIRQSLGCASGAAAMIGVRAFLVHAISEEAEAFYERYGSRLRPSIHRHCVITVEEAQRILKTVE